MGEGIYIHNYEKNLIIQYNESWYQIPFFVLEGLCEEWGYAIENSYEMPGPEDELDNWITRWSHPHTWNGGGMEKAITEFKKFFNDRMPGMEAYKLYNV